MWIGSLLVISTLMTLVPAEEPAARARLVAAARRLFHISTNIGAIVAVIFGIFATLVEPQVLRRGWLHAKIALVLVLLFFHVRLYRRLIVLDKDSSGARRGEFSMIHGVVSLLTVLILILVFLKPF